MKVGLIGLGRLLRKHILPILTEFPSIEPVFCTRNSQIFGEFVRNYRVNGCCSDYKQLINMGIDAVMIHSATSTHVEIASFFLKHFIPVFVDKPLLTDNTGFHEPFEWYYQ